MSTIKPTYETNDGFAPMEPLPSIREVCAAAFALHRRYQPDQEREAEDMQDRKAVWLLAATQAPRGTLTQKERTFVERYTRENIKLSIHWNLKPEIAAFYQSQVDKFNKRNNEKLKM